MPQLQQLFDQVRNYLGDIGGGDQTMILVYIVVAVVAVSIIGFILKMVRRIITYGLVIGFFYLFSQNNFDIEATIQHLTNLLSGYKSYFPQF